MAGCTHFINADLIAAGLSPLAQERELLATSRIFLQEIEERIAAREDFAFETTLAFLAACAACSTISATASIAASAS